MMTEANLRVLPTSLTNMHSLHSQGKVCAQF